MPGKAERRLIAAVLLRAVKDVQEGDGYAADALEFLESDEAAGWLRVLGLPAVTTACPGLLQDDWTVGELIEESGASKYAVLQAIHSGELEAYKCNDGGCVRWGVPRDAGQRWVDECRELYEPSRPDPAEMTVYQLAKREGVTVGKVGWAVKSGQLPVTWRGRRRYIKPEDARRWLSTLS